MSAKVKSMPKLKPQDFVAVPDGFRVGPWSEGQLVTIYATSEMMGHVVKWEGRLVDCGFVRYAQYPAVPSVRYIPKGKRNPSGFVKADSRPFMLVIAGHGHPEPASMFGDADATGCRTNRFQSFSREWTDEFNAMIAPVLKTADVILDARSKDAGIDWSAR